VSRPAAARSVHPAALPAAGPARARRGAARRTPGPVGVWAGVWAGVWTGAWAGTPLAGALLAGLAAALLVTADAPARAADRQGRFAVFGSGELSCQRWLDDRRLGNESARQSEMWVAGFLTAYNFYVYKDYDITERFDDAVVLEWLDEYCRDRPQNKLVVASHELLQMLRRRR
jgi:hypothetical protein